MKQVNMELKKYPGESSISVLIPSGGGVKKLDLPFKIEPDLELLEVLEGLLGQGSVKIS